MLKPIFTLLLAIVMWQTTEAQWREAPQPPSLPTFPQSAHPKNEGLYRAMQIGGIAMEITGSCLIFRGIRADIDESINGWLTPNYRPVDSEPLYVAGASMLMAGVVLNIFGNAKLYPQGMKTNGNGISYNIPRSNKHFGQ